MKIEKIILVSCIILIVVLLAEAYRENINNEWHHYQKFYKRELKKIAANEKERKVAEDYAIKMRQIVIPELNRIDRCVICHVGIEDPRMVDVPQPIKVHPGNILGEHELEKIGCTVCHDGQGRAITEKEAHGVSVAFWEKPLMSPPFLESNCIRCHTIESLPKLTFVKKGKEIFLRNGCLGCHEVRGKGGNLAPELTNISDANVHLKHPVSEELTDKFHKNPNIAYIYESIKQPGAQPEVTAMPDFHFSEDEILALTVFLKSLSKKEVPTAYLAEIQEGKQPETVHGGPLYRKYCVACHGVDAKGGVKNINYIKRTVPALNTLAERMFLDEPENAHKVSELLKNGVDINKMAPKLDVPKRGRVLAQYRAIRNIIKRGSPAGKADPEGPEPLLHMPSWAKGLSDKDIDSIIAYLLTLYPWGQEETGE